MIQVVWEKVPDNVTVMTDVAYHENRLGDAARRSGRLDDAALHYQKARETYVRIDEIEPRQSVRTSRNRRRL